MHTTPDVAVPAKQAQHITHAETVLQAEPYDISAERDLANAVLCRALEDSRSDPVARKWFEQTPQPMLTFWCQLAGMDPDRLRKRARKFCEEPFPSGVTT